MADCDRRRQTWLIAFLPLLLALPVSRDFLKPAAPIASEHGSTSATESGGKARWTAEWTMDPWQEKGKPAIRFSEKGRGRYSGFDSEVQWSLEAVWLTDGRFQPLRFEKTFSDLKGRTLATEKKTFSPLLPEVRLEKLPANGPAETKTMTIPADTLTVEGIAGIFQHLPFASSRPFRTHLLTNDWRVFDVSIEPRARERVRTPAGEFECYKVEVVPHLGILDIVKPFVARTYFWFSVAEPHFWVKYEGLENGLGTPKIVMELQALK